MEEVKIVLTREEAKLVRDAIWIRIKDNRDLADYFDEGQVTGRISDEYIELCKLYNKIQAASYESK